MDFETRLAALECRLSGGRILVGVYGNENHAERQEQIKINQGSPYTYRYCLMSVRLPVDVLAGDVLQVTAEFQVTSEYPGTIMVASQIKLGETTADWEGPEISENNGQNIKGNEEHHYARTRVGTFVAEQDYPRPRVNLWVWSSDPSSDPGWRLDVDPDRGRLVIHHYR